MSEEERPVLRKYISTEMDDKKKHENRLSFAIFNLIIDYVSLKQ